MLMLLVNIESGYECSGPTCNGAPNLCSSHPTASDSVCKLMCGDGSLQTSNGEQCDDGN